LHPLAYFLKSMLKVSCAIIESQGKVLAAQRGPGMNLPGKWEFPGGKVEAGESAEACIRREIREELNLEIEPSLPPASSSATRESWSSFPLSAR
jgi:8-oxo-dGTP diphosphatase